MSLESLINPYPKAALVLADGSIFPGFSIGVEGETVGEVVFNTSMSGYQEILTDPSYTQQIVTLTSPHIGNVGVNPHDTESYQVFAAGLIIKQLSPVVSSWRATQSLSDYLKKERIVAISGVDTRRLTRLLRDKGAMNGCIVTGICNIEDALDKAREFPGLEGVDLAKKVSINTNNEWAKGTFDLMEDMFKRPDQSEFHVVAYDFGVKSQILRLLADRGCRITVVPAKKSAEKVLEMNPDGVFLSNGPGDPAACDYAVENIRTLLSKKTPLFGICLGFQLMALACDAKTVKMKFGHHGANHPVQDLNTSKVSITSQNHGFMVDTESLPNNLRVTHYSLFDGSLQGFEHRDLPAFAFQGHPEASPGPHDIEYLFDHFITLMRDAR